MANIPEYLPITFAFKDIFKFVDGVSENPKDKVPVLFDWKTLQPIDFDEDEGLYLYIPLLTEEGTAENPIKYLLLTSAIDYIEKGEGIPGSQDLSDMGFTDPETLITAMQDAGLITPGNGVGVPFSGGSTITESEEDVIRNAITEYNSILQELSDQFDVPLADINNLWDPANPEAFGGYSGEFVLFAPSDTTFSLDGVHPNNLGHAIIANAFIEKINETLNLDIPELYPEDFKGQYQPYVGTGFKMQSIKAIKGVREFYIQRK